MNKAKRGKKRKHRAGSISYYIEKVVSYSSEYETGDSFKDGYPPVMAELLLSILIEVRTLFTALRILVGALIGSILVALLKQFLM